MTPTYTGLTRRSRCAFPMARLGGQTLPALLTAALLGVSAQHAQATEPEFPQAPISIIVPFAAGGSLDATARALGKKISELVKQPVIILNRPGAGSAVGARLAATSKPDGYTTFIASGSAFGFVHLLVRNHEFRLKDYAPIAGLGIYTSLFATNNSIKVKTLSELAALANSKPGGLSICSTGANGINHLQLEMFRYVFQKKHPGQKLNITHVPYNGVAPALIAIKAGDVDACVLPYSALVKQMDGTDLHVIAVQRPTRLPALPNAQTTGEQGYSELDGNEQLVTISAPAGTPSPVLQRLETAFRDAMSNTDVMKSLNDLDVQPRFVGSEEARKWLENDVKKLENVIREANIGNTR